MLSVNLSLLLVTLTGSAVIPLPFERPDVIRWGASTTEMERSLAGRCKQIQVREIDPPFLRGVQDEQLQIDCEGFPFRHLGRHVEFVIRDDRLVLVWLMVEPHEQDAILKAMRKALGPPTGSNGRYISWERHRIAWRFKPAEILFYSPDLDDQLTPDFR